MRWCVFPIFVFASLAAAQTGSIGGRAVAADGRGLRGFVFLRPARGPSQNAATDASGAFRFQKLPAGQYWLCAQPMEGQGRTAAERFVNTCTWGPSAGPFQLAAGQALAGVNLVAPPGTLLQVHLDDPDRVLPRQAAATAVAKAVDSQLTVSVRGADKLVRPVPITAVSGVGRDHAMVVPYAVPLWLSVKGPGFNLTDSAGKSVANEDLPMQAVAGAALAPVGITVRRGRP